MEINTIMAMAKQNLIRDGYVKNVALIYENGQMHAVMLVFNNSIEKNDARQELKRFILENNFKQYFVINEAWSSNIKMGEKIFRVPSRDVDRREAIIVCQYNSLGTEKTIMQFFKRKDNKIIFEETESQTRGFNYDSYWNAYIDEEKVRQKDIEHEQEINNAFISNMAKQLTKKYFSQLKEAKSEEEIKNIFIKIQKEAEEIYKKQMQTIYEDVEKDEEFIPN